MSIRETPPRFSNDLSLEEAIVALFELGGVVSGGHFVKQLYRAGFGTKDIDFYFNDYWEEAHRIAGLHPIDICWYVGCPYELHDLSVIMGFLDGGGVLHTSGAAELTRSSGVLQVNWHNLLDPDRTVGRVVKYCRRLGLRVPAEQLLTLLLYCTVDFDVAQFKDIIILA